jgi:hypothetical protein
MRTTAAGAIFNDQKSRLQVYALRRRSHGLPRIGVCHTAMTTVPQWATSGR